MSTDSHFDILIVGSGLAGSLCAEQLSSSNLRIGLLDHQRPELTTSLHPGALLNPIPGATLSPRPGTLEAYGWTLEWLSTLPAAVQAHVTTGLELIRPYTLETRTGRRLHRSFQEHQDKIRSHISARLVNTTELRGIYPGLQGCDGAVILGGAATLPIAALVTHLYQRLDATGVNRLTGKLTHLAQTPTGWQAETTGGIIQAERVVLAMGTGLTDIFENFPLRQTAGHLAIVKFGDGLPRTHAISGRGHLAPLWNGTWSFGATYHQEESPEPTTEQEVLDLLVKKMAPWLPQVREAEIVQTWRGVRAVVPPERQPVVGAVPNTSGLFILGAFASRGLQWIPWAAHTISRHLALGDEINVPAGIATNRFSDDIWAL